MLDCLKGRISLHNNNSLIGSHNSVGNLPQETNDDSSDPLQSTIRQSHFMWLLDEFNFTSVSNLTFVNYSASGTPICGGFDGSGGAWFIAQTTTSECAVFSQACQ
jgi:hypothetical protein